MDDMLTIVIISDSTGETANVYLKSVTSQFPGVRHRVVRRPDITDKKEIDQVLEEVPSYAILVKTVASHELSQYIN